MDVILVSVDLFDDGIGMMFRPGLNELFDIALNSFVEDDLSIFGRPDQVEITSEYAVTHSAIYSHAL